ncbi:MAG: DMT family transporter [Rhodovibrionaceae bacterium]
MAAIILLWGVNWPVMKFGLTMITPFWFGVARLGLGALTLFLVLALTRKLILPPRGDWPVVVSVGIFQMTSFMVLVNLGLVSVGAGRSAVLAYTTPLWVAPAAVLLFKERVTPLKLAGLVCGLAGIALLFNPLTFDWNRRETVIGNAILMLAALSWAGAILHIRRHKWQATPLQLTPWQMLLALPILVALALIFEDAGAIRFEPELIAVLVYNGPLATAFCFWAAVTVSRALPSIHTSLGFLGVPAVGVISSAWVLGEAVGLDLIGGGFAVLAGLVLVTLADRPAETRAGETNKGRSAAQG